MLGLFLPILLSLSILLLPLPWVFAPIVLLMQCYFWPGKHWRARMDHYLLLDGRFMAGEKNLWNPGALFWRKRQLTMILTVLFAISALFLRESFTSPVSELQDDAKRIEAALNEDLKAAFAANDPREDPSSQKGELQQYDHVFTPGQEFVKESDQNKTGSQKRWKIISWTNGGSGEIGY